MKHSNLISIGVQFEPDVGIKNKVNLVKVNKELGKNKWCKFLIDDYTLINYKPEEGKSISINHNGSLSYHERINKGTISLTDLQKVYNNGKNLINILVPKIKHKRDRIRLNFDSTENKKPIKNFYNNHNKIINLFAMKYFDKNYKISEPTTFGNFYLGVTIFSQKPLLPE